MRTLLCILVALLPATAWAAEVKLPEKAAEVQPGKAVKHTFAKKGEVLWLRFEAAASVYAVFTQVRGKKASVRLHYSLLDAAGKAVADTDQGLRIESSRGEDAWSAIRLDPGKYILAVRAEGAFPKTVQLRVDLLAEMDVHEPNDTPDMARTVPLNRKIALTILPANDDDWLQVTVPADGILTLRHLSGKWPRPPLQFELREAKTDKVYGLGGRRARASEARWATRVAGGLHRVRVSGPSSLLEQTIQLDFEPRTDLHEPNDDADHAAAVSGPVRIRCYPPGDEDWFAVRASEVAILTICQVGAGSAPTSFRGEVLLAGRKKPTRLKFRYGRRRPGHRGRDLSAALDVLPGIHKIRLVGKRPSRGLLTVDFDLRPNDDPYEPNNTREAARPIPLGRETRFRLMPQDEDWFYFDAPSDGIATFHFLKRPHPCDPAIAVYGPGQEKPVPVEWHTWKGGAYDVGAQRNYQRAMPVKKGRVVFVVKDRTTAGGHFLHFRANFYPKADKSEGSLFVIGFDTDEEANEQIRAIAGAGSGRMLATTQPAKLPELLTRAVDLAREARAPAKAEPDPPAERPAVPSDPPPWFLWVCVAAGGVLVSLVAWLLVRKRRPGDNHPPES